METFRKDPDSRSSELSEHSSSSYSSTRQANSDEETTFATIATSSPKRRAGRTKFRETRHPVYKGVRERNGGKWVCEVREPNKKSRIWLGTFPTAEMAARAHDVAAMALRGRSACLNFADSAWLLPLPESANAKDIQRAATEAAEAFRPSLLDAVSSNNNVKPESPTPSLSDAVSSDNNIKPESPTPSSENVFSIDEEDFLDMPGLLTNMAEGLLLSPPPCLGSGPQWDNVEADADMSLWSYSF